jgi:hypothetical protein
MKGLGGSGNNLGLVVLIESVGLGIHSLKYSIIQQPFSKIL